MSVIITIDDGHIEATNNLGELWSLDVNKTVTSDAELACDIGDILREVYDD